MHSSWISQLQDELLRMPRRTAGWSYRPDGEPYVEPTALVALALAASATEPEGAPAARGAAQAAGWLATSQQADGALGLSPTLTRPRWTTSLGVLAWGAAGGFEAARQKGLDWLLATQGETRRSSVGTPVGHDPQIPGWPWVEGTQSWLEPTALAVLALRSAGLNDHPRTRDGQRLICNRAVRTGGWNYGNSTVFGADLRPQPLPTGLALLALAGDHDSDDPLVARGCAYLEDILPTTHAPESLCWGTLALSAWERRPGWADDQLAAAHRSASKRSDSVVQLAALLLAAGPRSLELVGCGEKPRSTNP